MKIQLKRSNVLSSGAAKTPTASQLEYGELAVNYNTSDPAIFLKDSNNNIIRISGVGNIADDGLTNVPDGTTPPSNPEAGNLWYNSDQGRLYIYFEDADTSQWVDASPDSWDPSSYPDVTNNSAQANTLDDRYAMVNGGNSFTGDVKIGTGTSRAGLTVAKGVNGIPSPGANNASAVFSNATDNATYGLIAGANGSGTGYLQVQRTDGNTAVYPLAIQPNGGNVGIGTSSFTASSSGRQILEINGTSSSLINLDVGGTRKAYHFTDGTDAYSVNTANGAYIFGTSNAEALRIDSSGNVGVGTSSTTSISNYTTFTLNGATGGNLEFQDGGTLKGSLYNTASEFILQAQGSSTPLAFRTNATERLRIDSSGNVGIGTTSPAQALEVNGNIQVGDTASSAARIDFGSASTRIQHNGDDNLPIFTNGAERLRIDNSGRLLVGTSSQSQVAKFVVQGQTNDAAQGGYMRLQTNSSVTDGSVLGTIGFGDTANNGANIQSRGSMSWSPFGKGSDLMFSTTSASSTGPDERMRITSSGNVGIGTSSPNSTNRYVQIHNGNNASSSYLHLTNTGTGSGNSDGLVMGMGDATNVYFWNYEAGSAIFATSASERMRIDSAGNIGFGTASPSASTVEIFQKSLKLSRTSLVTANSTLSLTHASAADHGSLYFDNSASTGGFVFRTNGSSEKVRILGGGGITFNGDTGNAGALDDYEEGSCTITLYVAGTTNVNGATNTVAYYSKVGNIVNVSYYSGVLSLTHAGTAEIDGLPFVAKNVNQHFPPGVFTHTNCFTTDIQNGYMNTNTNNLYPIQRNSTAQAQWNTSGGSRYIMFSITYQTN